MRLVAENWTADNQEIEGIMSLIKLALRKAPSLMQPGVDAEVAVKKSAGLGSRGSRHVKWSDIAGRFDEIIDMAEESFDGINDILGNETRFQPPLPSLRDYSHVTKERIEPSPWDNSTREASPDKLHFYI